MSRVRLTNRRAADMSIPYPGNVNQPNRKDPGWEDYHTFEQTVNHELPDMRDDWKNDERDGIGFGKPEPWGESPNTPGALPPPTVASVRVAANKAVRIAVLLLGEKVDDDVIEAQARDLMTLSGESMDRTLGRFAETQKLYADDDKDEDDKKAADEKDEEKKAADEKKEDEKKASDDKDEDDKKAAKKDDDKKSAEKDEEEKKAADEKDEEKKAADKKEMPQFIKDKIEESKEKKGSKELAEKADKKSAEKEEEQDEKKAADEKDEDKKAMSAKLAQLESVIASIKKSLDEKEEEKKAADEKDEEKKAADEKKDDEKKAEDKKEDEKKAADEKEEDKKAADEKKDEEKKAEDKEDEKKEAKKAGSTEMDIELTGSMDDEVEPDPEADAQLASLFEDRTAAEEDVDEKKVDASKKAGIKKLGGQPKVASTTGAGVTDISQLWETAPDVSEVFK